MVDASEYLGLFLDESREHLQELNASLLDLERDSSSEDAVASIFRAAHTLKGMSATMGFEAMAHLTHRMEEVLSLFRDAERPVTSDVVDVLFACLDTLESMVDDIGEGGAGQADTEELLGRLAAAEGGEAPEPAVAAAEAAATVAPEKVEDDTEASADDAPEPAGDDAPDAAADDSAESVSDRALGEYERVLIQEARERGAHAVRLRFGFVEECLLRAARAAMAIQTVEAAGDLVAAEPTLDELQSEEPPDVVTLWITTKDAPDDLAEAVSAVSEIADVAVDQIADTDVSSPEAPADPAAEETSPAAQETAPAEEPKSSPAPAATASAPGKPAAPGGPDPAAASKPAPKKAASTVRVGTDKLDELMNLMGEMVIQRTRLAQAAGQDTHGEVNAAIDDFGRVANDLQTLIMQMRMTAVDVVFQRFPRMVRDLGNSLEKKIELIITGEDTELDRTVIDELGDPLVHLLRNAADHGLESPAEREAAGKDPVGTIRLAAHHTGNSVEITVSEDGRGIDPDGIRGAAVKKGLMDRAEADALSDQEAIELIFRSGFSTAAETTDVSGRGVGMDAVRSKIRGLNGDVVIDSTLGEGTTFTITLPLTLAIIQALLVRSGQQVYALPLDSIEETVVLQRDETRPVNGQDCMVLRDHIVPLIALRDRLRLSGDEDGSEQLNVVVVRSGDSRLGVVVGALVGQQDIVIKHLPDYLGDVEGVAGATILGDGSVALIVDVGALKGPGKGGQA